MKVAIKNGTQIPRFVEGKGGPNPWCASDMNRLVDAINALLNPTISEGESNNVKVTDSNVHIQVARSAASGGTETRLFNYNVEARTAFGSHAFTGDVGALVPGWTAAVQTNIAIALRAGRRIRTTMAILFTVVESSDVIPCQADYRFTFYTGDTSYAVTIQASIPAGLSSAQWLMTFQGELYQVKDGANVIYHEAATIYSAAYSGAPIADPISLAAVIVSGHAPAAVTDAADGKIMGEVEAASNCTFGVSLQNLTIDVIDDSTSQ